MELKKRLLLDGAMGTMLQQSGLPVGHIPELLNLSHPDALSAIQRQYVQAGSDIIYANTFGINRHKLRGSGHRVRQVVTAGIRCARRACEGYDTLVALDVGPLGELLEPMGSLTFEEAYDLFAEIMVSGAQAGADLIVIETMTDLYEAKAALLAAKEKTGLPVFVTMSFNEDGRTFTGCTPASMAAVLDGLGADAIGVNCSLGPDKLLPVIRELRRATALPIIAKPNAGLPDPIDGHYDLQPADFAEQMRLLLDAGVSIVGGCCGTSPAYIRALKEVLPDYPGLPESICEALPFLCTPTIPLSLDRLRVIGERINPTGKKRFRQALLENDLDYIADVAVAQLDAGAEILDINVGAPGVDELTMLPRVVKAVQAVVPLPLQLDSSNPEALEAALRVVNGKALVNSVNGKEESLQAVLPMVKKYGAAVVGLTLDEAGLPDSREARIRIAERILKAATELGIRRENVCIDCLTLTVSAQQDQVRETLAAVQHVHQVMKLPTVLGVSNISFGLPARPVLTQAFLLRAIQAGLTLPIINPNQREMMDAIAACRALDGIDAQCAEWVARMAPAADAPVAAPAASAGMLLSEAIERGLKAQAARLAGVAIANGAAPLSLVQTELIPALDRIGLAYEKGSAFLPQLLSAAQAAQSVFEVIKHSIKDEDPASVKKDRIILATVYGDIHDIGKNIVRTVLENYGFDVMDLGRDVPVQKIVDAVAETNARLVGLSALMTTTLPAMEETVRALKAMSNPPSVMVGGAVVTDDYARTIGADAYAHDARASAEIARRFFCQHA